MANADPHDAKSLISQIKDCASLGCDIFRLAIPDLDAATALREVKKASPIPLVADIQFDYLCALASIDAGVDALRINPGNIGSRDKVQAIVRAAKDRKVPIRIGVNLGSLEHGFRDDLESGKLNVPAALVKSALGQLKVFEDEGFRDVVISAKASNVKETITTYRLLSECTDCPLHVGVTEAGTLIPGTVRSSVALGVLLGEGIGDTIRVSLTAKPEKEVRVGMEILRALGLREPGPAITSCPSCGRTKVDLAHVASQVEIALETLAKDGVNVPKVAVMGCAVNGPGEARGADIALCGGDGDFLLYVRGKQVCRVSEEDAAGKVVEYAVSL
jgi:(E)-4-hydroxy-3-methylbut-2-enyl-diphosphate synthase